MRCLRVSRSVFLPAHRSELGAERASQLSRAWGDAGHETQATEACKTCTIILSQKRKNNCETLMTDGESASFFFSFSKFHFGHFSVCHSPCHR